MLVYGTKASRLKSEQSQTTACPSCGTQGSLIFSVFRKYFHVFWLPLFPVGKTVVSQCQHCKNTLEYKEMPEHIQRECKDIKQDAKGPLWQFSGLGVIAILIACISYMNAEDKKLELEYIASPQKGDIYEYKTEASNYSTLKVTDVTEDDVLVAQNNYQISKRSKIYKIEKPENYADSSYRIAKSKLKEMYDSGEIFDINR